MVGSGEAAEAGKHALAALRRSTAERLVGALDEHDPELLAALSEVGLLRRAWVEDRDDGPMSAPATEVIQRVLQRSVERQPSVLASLGLSVVDVLSSLASGGRKDGSTTCLVVGFTDLEGFTRYTARNGDAAARALLDPHHRAVGAVVRSRGGRVVKRLGDGCLVTFPEASGAVLAALELVTMRPGGLRVRAGFHIGDVIAVHDDLVGHVVNVAARVTESAEGGEVVVSTDVRDAAGADLAGVRFTRARRRGFKGLEERLAVCRALPA